MLPLCWKISAAPFSRNVPSLETSLSEVCLGAASVAMHLVYSDVPRRMDYFGAKRIMYVEQTFHGSNVRCLNRRSQNILAHPEHVRSGRFIPTAGQMPLEESQPAGKHIFCEGLSAARRHRRGGSTGSPPAPPCREPLFKNRAQDPAADLSCPQPRVCVSTTCLPVCGHAVASRPASP